MAWTQPITDRTTLDIDKLQEYDEIGYKNLTNDQKAEWLLGMKGALNASDLNRIESNQQFILNLLSAQYALTFKTNWLMTDFVEDSDENRILMNLKTLMQPFNFEEEPQVPEKPLNYFEKINQIENIILQMYDKYYSKIKYYEFQTDNGEDFLVDDENFIVNDNILRDGFLTNQDEPFITSGDEDLNVFTQQIQPSFSLNDIHVDQL